MEDSRASGFGWDSVLDFDFLNSIVGTAALE